MSNRPATTHKRVSGGTCLTDYSRFFGCPACVRYYGVKGSKHSVFSIMLRDKIPDSAGKRVPKYPACAPF